MIDICRCLLLFGCGVWCKDWCSVLVLVLVLVPVLLIWFLCFPLLVLPSASFLCLTFRSVVVAVPTPGLALAVALLFRYQQPKAQLKLS